MDNLSATSRSFPFQTMFIEVFSIVLAVSPALFVNEWREDRSSQARAEAALQNIENEIRSNLELLNVIHVNNLMAVRIMNGEEVEEGHQAGQFIPGIQIQETAWSAFNSTGVLAYVDYETVLKLSNAYAMQRVLKQTSSQLTQASMSVAAFATALGSEIDPNDSHRHFADIIALIVTVEEALLDSYEEVLTYLDSRQS